MFCYYSNISFRFNNNNLKTGFVLILFVSVAFSFILLTCISNLKGNLGFRMLFFSINKPPVLASTQSRKDKSSQRKPKYDTNIVCHYIDINDALLPIEKDSSIPWNSIFFHETSCRGQLNSRQACSVESAARAHPHWQINVLFSGPVTNENLNIHGSLNALKQFTNVKLFRLHLLEYVKGTPVEGLVRGGVFNRSLWPIQHTSDLLRLLTLSKWGGVYLDLDQLVVKSFEDLGSNWVVRETNTTLAGSPLSIAKNPLGKAVVDTAIRAFKTNYNETKWSCGSTYLITDVLKKLCNVDDINSMLARTCWGFRVFNKELFFPVGMQFARKYFDHKDMEVGYPYAHHMYNMKTAEYKVTNESVYARMAQKYCPTIHELYGDQFGK